MTIVQFEQEIANYLNRDVSLFGAAPNAKLRNAANMMKKHAQRLLEFEWCKRYNCTLVVDKTLGGSLTAVKNASGTTILTRHVKRVFLQSTGGTAQLWPVQIISREQQMESLKRQVENINPIDIKSNTFANRDSYVQAVIEGQTLSIWPWPSNLYTGSSTTVTLDVVEWLPDYVNDADEDFLLKECVDWALYQTVIHLNLFLKEDQRISINYKYAADLWQTVVAWNTSLVSNNIPIDLE